MRTWIALMLLSSAAAHADEPATMSDRLVSFARTGCDFLREQAVANPNAASSPRKLAAHFGRITREAPNGATRDYFVAVAAFPGWKVVYEARILKLYLPNDARVRLAELEKRLGKPSPPDVDAARPAGGDVSDAKAIELEWVFPASAIRRGCWIRATTKGHADDDAGEQPVLTFSFQG